MFAANAIWKSFQYSFFQRARFVLKNIEFLFPESHSEGPDDYRNLINSSTARDKFAFIARWSPFESKNEAERSRCFKLETRIA